MEEKTKKIINQKIRDLLYDNTDMFALDKAITLIKAINTPLNDGKVEHE